MKPLLFISFIVVLLNAAFTTNAQPTISFTFDDGDTGNRPGYPFEQWNNMLLSHLDSAGIKTVFFVTGQNKMDEKGQALLKSWDSRGHKIGNHTYTHPNYNKKEITLEQYQLEFLRTDSVINQLDNYVKLFRFPYLKEGDTKEKAEGFRAFLKKQNYKNGQVTIDASDWYIDSRLRKALRENENADIEGFRKFYLEHLYERALFYEDLAYKLTGRHIKHTLLLHHNLAAALFVGDAIKMFKDKGWKVIDASEAFTDKIFNEQPTNIPAGESLIWALAKQSGKFESVLRYPAEDSSYEEDKMNKLGL